MPRRGRGRAKSQDEREWAKAFQQSTEDRTPAENTRSHKRPAKGQATSVVTKKRHLEPPEVTFLLIHGILLLLSLSQVPTVPIQQILGTHGQEGNTLLII